MARGRSRTKLTRSVIRRAGALGHGDLAASLVLIFPLFLAYEVGVVFSTTSNGVDFLTRWVYAAAGNRSNYLLIQALLAVVYVGYLLYLRRHSKRSLGFDSIPLMVLESGIYAITLGSFIVFVMQELLGFELAVSSNGVCALGRTGEAVVISLGAGVHEELVFRLGLMAGGVALLVRGGVSQRWALVAALLVSAVVFSAAHHVGPHGDPFAMGVFTYRALAGVVFGVVFYYRSLAHAVYTHFLYDFYVLVIRG